MEGTEQTNVDGDYHDWDGKSMSKPADIELTIAQ